MSVETVAELVVNIDDQLTRIRLHGLVELE